MSDDNKNLSDDLNDMLGDAKEGAKKAADKASELAGEAKEKASEFADDAKEFAGDAKEKASEFANDVKDTLSDGKNVAIIAHITIIGWIIALVMNSGDKKSEYGSFYIRQMLGLALCGLVLSFIPMVGWLLNLGIFVLWIMSLIGSLSGEKKLVPALGSLFQDWFKSL
ncbi:YtxH domain-containing protein [Psychroserpens ponticola]|uniref:YtxH domain-containing protein n=1 Tax=Psychroserpens ponticola TaxID=2932268 RepID=A0ABY7S1W6_9FLAO|nr:YtxH domain-containing protein [Psychroserpens ponticola]WCO01905.1 YtxH domain-containing protein [Psychroserpens ponticola]